jgi:hypothetical protein
MRPALAGLLAAALVATACLPPPARPLPPPVAPPLGVAADSPVRPLLALPPVPFVEHREAEGQVVYRARAGGLTARYAATGVAYGLIGHDPAVVAPEEILRCRSLRRDACAERPPTRRWHVQQEFVGARRAPPVAAEPADTVVSYFVGPPSEWRTALPTYRRLVFRDLWPGIDLAYERDGARGLKSTYHVAPGADPTGIRALWRGATARLDEDGALVLATPLGELRESPPVAWQDVEGGRLSVAVRFEIVGRSEADGAADEAEVGFALGAYDRGRPLVIDPTLLYATYLGGNATDQGNAIAVDATGAAYVAGETESDQTSFPDGDPNVNDRMDVPGFDQVHNGGMDAFVAKLSPDGRSLVYVSYVGGSGTDVANGVAVDATGAAYVVGETDSSGATFPVSGSVPGFDRSYNGGDDAFVVKLTPAGTALAYATYLGGAARDVGEGIAVDSGGAAYVVGRT